METLQTPDNTALRFVSLGDELERYPTLVFLHGWTANVREWLPFATPLSEDFHTLCWDARGHGGHQYDGQIKMDIGTMADDLDLLLEKHSGDKAILVGHSMGALTGWEYIRRHGTDKLAGFCIIDQSPKLVTDETWGLGIYGDFDRQYNQGFLQRLDEDFAEAVLELVANGLNLRSRENYLANSHGFQQMRDYLQQLPGPMLTECWRSLSSQDYRGLLPKIDIPCLQIYGDSSQFYSQELAQWVCQQLPESRLLTYEKADHSPHLWHKERFIYDLKQFCLGLAK
ncbi:alpha/beta hydrolase [Motiliproteus coralliicola]|uniref:Alpha/beta hydrolase n=1 Tax=Motiliproteus coralliicola TaxID=2283196 RepID=A0A369WVW8_9GAMM|nr:alpha/beta hydrolase [Motiliproteus coralliicola]RDE24694.1 alpha/beta hydrolase [Motiliproteus coralliicola]